MSTVTFQFIRKHGGERGRGGHASRGTGTVSRPASYRYYERRNTSTAAFLRDGDHRSNGSRLQWLMDCSNDIPVLGRWSAKTNQTKKEKEEKKEFFNALFSRGESRTSALQRVTRAPLIEVFIWCCWILPTRPRRHR